MEDLGKLNRQIAIHWLGRLDTEQEAYLEYASVCLGQLTISATDMDRLLEGLKQKNLKTLLVAKLNRRYLKFARLAAKEALAGKFDMLIRLDITLEQAELLGRLTDEDIDRLAFGWNGPIVQFATQVFRKGVALHAQAGKHHATAFVAARTANPLGKRT